MNAHRQRWSRKDAGTSGANPPANPPATPPATPPPAGPEVDLKAITDAIGASVKAALDPIAAQFRSGITAEQITAAVIAGLNASAPNAAPAAITADQIKSAATTAAASLIDGIRTKAPNLFIAGDLKNPDSNVEFEYGPTKGNLPVHMKQLSNIILRRPQDEGIDSLALGRAKSAGDFMLDRLKTKGTKALTSSGTGTGVEWMPRDLSAELYRRLYLNSDVARGFIADEIQMTTDPYDTPLLLDNGDFQASIPEGQDAVPSDPTTGKWTLTTKPFVGLRQLTDNANEDSIIPMLPILQETLAAAGARSLENALINGDTTATHMDSDVTSPISAAKAWKGFRKLALAVAALKSDLSSGGISRANCTALLKLLGKYGSPRGRDLLWIFGPKVFASLMGLDEFALAYARGAASSFTEGNLPTAPWGGQYAVSDQCREDLNASGVYDATTTTKGCILVVHRPMFKMGYRRQFTIELDRRPRSLTWDVVASFRRAFSPVETPSASIPTVAVGYNFTA